MNRVALLLLFLTVFAYGLQLPAFAAATFSIDSTGHGAVQAEATVNKIGALLLADATAFLNEQTIEIKSNSRSADSNQPLLSGVILNAQQSALGHIRGIAFFRGGTSLSELCIRGASERVETTNGDIIEGKINDVTADGLTVTLPDGESQRIASNKVSCIDSSCAYEFDLTATSSKVTFKHASIAHAAHVKQSSNSASVHVTSVSNWDRARKVVLATVIVAAIATAIAVPVAVGTHHNRHHRNKDNVNNLFAITRARQLTATPALYP